MFILSSASSGLEFWSVNRTSIYENPKLNVFKIMKFFGKMSKNWPSDLLGSYANKNLESCW